MKVIILEHTTNPERAVASGARQCYSAEWIGDSTYSAEANETLIRKVLAMGHTSILEHASFTFAIEGISRTTSHQLVRHRIASFSQQSQRYVEFKHAFPYIIPQTIVDKPVLLEGYAELMKATNAFYKCMIDCGIPAEDARYILPNATETKLVMTMNARELCHLFELRCCVHAQWEIRRLANAMLYLVRGVAPVLFENAGPNCVVKGVCTEGKRSCGRVSINK